MARRKPDPCPICGWPVPDDATLQTLVDHVKDCYPPAYRDAQQIANEEIAKRAANN